MLTYLSTTLLLALLSAHPILAQEDMQAIAPSNFDPDSNNTDNNDTNNNPIQLQNPADQASYISPDSPTAIPTITTTTLSASTASSASSAGLGQVIVCTTIATPEPGTDTGPESNDTQGGVGGEEVSCETFTAVTSFSSLLPTMGILTASETRTTATMARETESARSTPSAGQESEGQGSGSGAERVRGGMGMVFVAVAGFVGLAGLWVL